MHTNNEASYYTVNPAYIRLNKKLSFAAKFLFAEIASKCNFKGYCWASNDFFCDVMNCDVRSVQRYLKELIAENVIIVELLKESGGTERKIFINEKLATELSQTHGANLSPTPDNHAANPGDTIAAHTNINTINKNNGNNIPFNSNELKGAANDKKDVTKKKAAPKPAKPSVKKKEKIQDAGGGNLRYKQFIDIYDKWFKDYQGMPPQIDGVQGRSAKSLIGYLEKIVKSRAAAENKTYTLEEIDNLVLQSWTIILQNWARLEPFYQDKTTIREINSNIQNIIKQIRHGKATAKPATGGQVSTASLSDAITKHYNNDGNPPGFNTGGQSQQ